VAISSEYLTFVIDQLAQCTEVRTRRMFGGVGIYHGEVFFALIDDDQLYFKVNETTREQFVSRGSAPFRPVGKNSKIVTLGYYTVPAEVLEDFDELKAWTTIAIAVARSAATNKSSARSARTRSSRKKR
jgi:DNA transformation protein and related proteins